MENKCKYDIEESLLLRYFNRQATLEECQYVEEWIRQSEINLQKARSLYHVMFSAATLRILCTTSPEKALKQVKQKMYRKNLRIGLVKKFQQIAAIFFIPLLIGLSYYILKDKEDSLDWVKVQMSEGMVGSIVLPDGSRVWLNSGSTIKYPSIFASDIRKVELSGEAYFSVEKEVDRKFEVRLNNEVTIEVLGTQFNVDAYENSDFISTTLVSGSVRLSYINEKEQKTSLLMQPNDKVIYNKESRFVDRNKVDSRNEIAWKDGVVILNNTPLKEVLWTLSKRFDVDFEVKNENLYTSSFTGVFDNLQLDRILEYFKIASHINYDMQQEVDEKGRLLKRKVILY